jgi:hypothetical protein
LHAAAHNFSAPSIAAPQTNIVELERWLRGHFEDVLSRAPPVSKQLNAGVRIADVNFGLEESPIRLFIKRGKLLIQIERLRNLERVYGVISAVNASRRGAAATAASATVRWREKRVKQLTRRVRAVLAELDAELDVIESSHKRVRANAAFITFEEEEAALRALEAYPTSTLRYCCQPRRLRINGTHRVWVEPAPQPSDIHWEHFARGTCTPLRRIFSVAVILGILVGSAYAVFAGKRGRAQA